MSLSCNNVQDYVTLYKDNVLSEETTAEIKEHLCECKECKRFYKDYDGLDTAVRPVENIPTEDANFAEIAKLIRKKKKKVSLLTVAGMMAVVAGTAYLSHLIFPPKDK